MPWPRDVDEGIGRAQVDGQVAGELAAEELEHRGDCCLRGDGCSEGSLAYSVPRPARASTQCRVFSRDPGREVLPVLRGGLGRYPVRPRGAPARPPTRLPPMSAALICGSLAYDTIMVFPDQFKNHILPDKVHILNVSFLVPRMRREFGGCAGNIAYNLKLLGGEPMPMATVGQDFGPYREWFDRAGHPPRPRQGDRRAVHRRRPSSPPTTTTTRSPPSIRAR